MPLTPLEIHNKDFRKSMRGYDIDEVNEFLDQVIRDYELLIRQNKEVKDELEIANKKLSNYEEMQESLNKSILVAQDAADRLKENTEREIEVIKREAESYAEETRKAADDYEVDVRKKADEYSEKVHNEAEDNADALLQEAVQKARKIEDETEALRKQSRVFRQRLQLLIESQLELLTKEDWDNLLVGKPIEYPNTETIEEVEKELEEKVESEEETSALVEVPEENELTVVEDGDVVEVDEAGEASVEAEDVSFEEDLGDSVANDEDERYNSESQEEEYEEGTMPAVELPSSAHE
ncbi:MAG TPA: DivIVA domain-containing protein [Atopostipes sp.]|nr:DivIVA domain-containing protein [Atopostipes sp.]